MPAGLLNSVTGMLGEAFPPKPTWTAENVPDLTGKVALITGANSGIGKETAKVLLQHNAKVWMACRSMDKANEAAEELKSLTGKSEKDIELLKLDLSDLASIKAAVDEFLSKETRLDILYNNGGVMRPAPSLQFTKHGHDVQFGTNVLGHFYLTQLLVPMLIASAKTAPDGSGKARIVNLSSSAHYFAPFANDGGPVNYDTLFDGPARNKFDIGLLYQQSKAGNLIVSNALARRYADQGIVSIGLNPGNIKSDLWKTTTGMFKYIMAPTLQPIPLGAITQLYVGTAPEALALNGKYLGPFARVRQPREDCEDIKVQDQLWAWLDGEVKKHAPPQ